MSWLGVGVGVGVGLVSPTRARVTCSFTRSTRPRCCCAWVRMRCTCARVHVRCTRSQAHSPSAGQGGGAWCVEWVRGWARARQWRQSAPSCSGASAVAPRAEAPGSPPLAVVPELPPHVRHGPGCPHVEQRARDVPDDRRRTRDRDGANRRVHLHGASAPRATERSAAPRRAGRARQTSRGVGSGLGRKRHVQDTCSYKAKGQTTS